MQIIILDTETTGLEEDYRLVQLAYKTITNEKIISGYFKPPILISFGAMATHHVTNEMVADKPSFTGSKEKNELIKILVGNVLAAHNALFDIGVLKNEGVKVERYIDTLRVAKHLIKCERYDLQYLRYYLNLGIPSAVAHDAVGDVIVLDKLFAYFTNFIKNKLNLGTDEESHEKMLELTNTPVLLDIIGFGKYRGKSFEELNQLDPGYLEWLYNSESKKSQNEQNEELIYTLKKHLYLDKI